MSYEAGNDLSKIFLPYQREWLADDSVVKISDKSRQIGLSWTEAFDAAYRASRSENGMDSWIIHLNEDSAREWVGDVAFWAKFLNAAAGEVEEVAVEEEKRDIKAFRIEFASGHRVTALSSRPSNLRGKRGKVVIEEAAFHESLDDLVKACMAFLIWGGRVSIISTHNGEESEYNQLLNQVRAGKKRGWSVHRVTFDQACEQGLYERIAERTGLPLTEEAKREWMADKYADYGEHADEELRCIPSRGGAIYLPRILAESCMDKGVGHVEWMEFGNEHLQLTRQQRKTDVEERCRLQLTKILNNIHPGDKTFFGQDFARSNNLSCIAVIVKTPQMELSVPLLLKLFNCPFEDQKQIALWLLSRLRKRSRFAAGSIDATGSGASHAEAVHEYHRSVEQTVINLEWHISAWPRYKAHLEDKSIKLPKDDDLLDSHSLIVKEKGVPHIHNKKTIKDSRGREAHADDLMAICLAVYASAALPDTTAYEAAFC